MTPERFQQIEELYHAARERGPGVLASTDRELRKEVEQLLTQDSGSGVLERPPLELLETDSAGNGDHTADRGHELASWVEEVGLSS